MNNVVLLQSGFATFVTPSLKSGQPLTANSLVNALRLGQTVVEGDAVDHLKYHPGIKQLRERENATARFFEDFDHREELLRVAKGIFGTDSFAEWCRIQLGSPSFTSLHKQFLLEMLQVLSGGRRRFQMLSWFDLVQLRPASPGDRAAPFDVSAYFGPGYTGGSLSRIIDVLVAWSALPGGMHELLEFLWVVFGPREAI